ncbi:MAG TPA: nucleotidyltransferase family protein, partial [Elusimicrobiales bacterium]|nr:nucleotidyltransferase family protein [Elusimicrobiales bacterium]
VLGRHEELILSRWRRNCERIALNPRPSEGQLSSVNAGLAALPSYAKSALLTLVDQPTIASDTCEDLVKLAQINPDSIIIPRCNGKRGHPIILPAKAWPLCAKAPLDKGLHWVTHHQDMQVMDLEVSDTGILRDIDTPAEYELLTSGGRQ